MDNLIIPSAFRIVEHVTALDIKVWSTVNNQDLRVRIIRQLLGGQIEEDERMVRTGNASAGLGSAQLDMFVLTMQPCFILGVTVSCDTTGGGMLGHGRVFVNISVRNNTDASADKFQNTILAGYVIFNKPLSYPGPNAIVDSWDAPGRIRLVTGTVPAAGQEFQDTVPSGVIWKVRSVRFLLTTSAVVTNRYVSMIFDNGVSAFFRTYGSIAQTASTAYQYSMANQASLGNGPEYVHSLPALVLPGGYRLGSSTSGLQVADQYSAIFYLVEELLGGI
jgi:hypothetical protein